jgi:hypothetical protein
MEPIAANRAVNTISGGYTMIPQKFYHPNASRNSLGLVGGNEVSQASGNLVDIESELHGTTRPLSKAPSRNYQPTCANPTIDPCTKPLHFTEWATGRLVTISTAPRHLPTTQLFSYPGVPKPEPFIQDVYGSPWRF